MHKLPKEIVDFYKENPEKLETRIYMEMILLENYLDDLNAKHLTAEAFKQWNRMWLLARSYWQFPETEDMKKMVDKLYALHQK